MRTKSYDRHHDANTLRISEDLGEGKRIPHPYGEPLANEALSIIEAEGWTESDIKFGKMSGLFKFLKRFAYEKRIYKEMEPSSRIRNEFTVAKNWPGRKPLSAKRMFSVAEQKLVPKFMD